MSGKFDEKRVINGSYGELWIDGSQIAEVSSVELNVDLDREEIKLAGQLEKGSKITGIEGTGSFTVKKVFSRFQTFWENLKLGQDQTFIMIVKLDDPDAYGTERFVASGCKFEGSFPLVKFDVGSIVEKDYSVKFKPSDSDYVSTIIDAAMV